jgi:hypothetical protein
VQGSVRFHLNVDRTAVADMLHGTIMRLPSFTRPRELRGSRPPVALLLFGLAVSVGCGDPQDRSASAARGRPIRGCENFSYEPCDILTAGCQRELFELVACLRAEAGVSEPPPVRQLDEPSAIALIEETSASEPMTDGLEAMAEMAFDQRAFDAEVRALELIGLLAPDLIEDVGDVIEQNIANVIAYYLVSTREIVIIDRGNPVDDLEANMVLAHELVHALQDTRHDLSSFDADQALDSDGILARSSLVEGEASLYQYLLGFAYRGADLDRSSYRSFFASLSALALDETRVAGSPAITASSIFPYTYGTAYAGQRWLSGGPAALDALYQSPPRTSWEVLGGVPDEARAMLTFDAAPADLEGYALEATDVVGAWVTIAMLAGLDSANGAASELPDLARRWRADRYWVYATAEDPAAVAALWAIEWADAEAAARFSTLAASLSPAGAVLRIDTSGAATRIVAVERPDDLEAWRARLAELEP